MMRNLTIKREKNFRGIMVPLDVYIEDPYSDITLCGIPCRLLGPIKNGAELTFPIEESSLKLFVIPHTTRPQRLNLNFEYYPIPAGSDDVFVSGILVFGATSMASFCFNVTGDEAGLQAIKQKSRKGTLSYYILMFSVMLAVIAVVGLRIYVTRTRPKDFTIDKMTITLTNEFQEYTDDDIVGFESKDVAVFIVNDGNLDELEVDTPDEYCRLLMLMDFSDNPSAKLQTSDDLPYIEYTYTEEDDETGKSYVYHYFAYAYHPGDDFWLITFALYDSDTAKYQSQITEWAKSVRFSD